MWYVNRCPDIAPEIRLQLLQRLASGLQRVHATTHFNPPPEEDVVMQESRRIRHNQITPHVPSDVAHGVHDVYNDVTSYVYPRRDVIDMGVSDQEEVCDLSVKRVRNEGIEENRNFGEGERCERCEMCERCDCPPGLEGESRVKAQEFEGSERYKTLWEIKDSRGMRGQEAELQGQGQGQGHSLLSDGVWRPF